MKLSLSSRWSLCALACAVLTGCFITRETLNEPLPVEAIRAMQPGQSTARDVLESLGAPSEVVQLGRRSAFRFDSGVTKRAGFALGILNLLGEDTRADRVWFFFDEADVLIHYGSTFASHRTQYALPWEDIHEESDSQSKDSERFGKAPEAD